mgnify:CR=1 FL=1
MYIYINVFLCFGVLIFLEWFPVVNGQVNLCQDNCGTADRLTGPFRNKAILPHPWAETTFPTNKVGFCKMGCQFFFSEFPVNTTCKRLCDFTYRYQVTVQYSDIAEQAINECRDGCDIALQICQPGFYCISGQMIPCEPGRFREAIKDISIDSLNAATECKECPPGRYRPQTKGKKPLDCSGCPIGKYAAVTGSVLVSDCQRCPAGKTAEEEGMDACKCITKTSCDYKLEQHGVDINYFANGVDFNRETQPYIGRW